MTTFKHTAGHITRSLTRIGSYSCTGTSHLLLLKTTGEGTYVHWIAPHYHFRSNQ